ncbi:MAG: SCO family protein [Acidimicrobiales bacterium]
MSRWSAFCLVALRSTSSAPTCFRNGVSGRHTGAIHGGSDTRLRGAGRSEPFDDKVVLVYFGYTNCPDVCPTTLSDVAKALATLGSDADRVTLVMVTIDPERDDLDTTGQYVRFFDERFHAASGPIADITDVATRYGVYFKASEADASGAYDMEHTGSLLGIDTDGNLRIVWAPGVDPDALAGDLSELLS